SLVHYVDLHDVRSFPTRRSSDLASVDEETQWKDFHFTRIYLKLIENVDVDVLRDKLYTFAMDNGYNEDMFLDIIQLSHVRFNVRSEEHTYELQSRFDLVCRLRLE